MTKQLVIAQTPSAPWELLPDMYKQAVMKHIISDEEETTEGISYDEPTRTIKANIGTLVDSKVIVFEAEVGECDSDTIKVIAKATAKGIGADQT